MERTDYCSPPEAAKLMMCSALHIRELIRKQKLPYYQVGNRKYIPREAIQRYVDAHTKQL